MSKRLYQKREKELTPIRMAAALQKISELGLEIIQSDETTVQFWYNDKIITFYPYIGWHSGKGIKDGRGADNLWKQIKN